MTVLAPPPLRQEVVKDPEELLTQNYFTAHWSNWLLGLYNVLKPGISVTITTAPLTGAGATGSMTFVNGILVSQTQAT